MVQDRLTNGEKYTFLGKNFADAFKFLASVKAEELEEGKITVNGDAVYALVQKYTTKDPSEGALETHKRYADIQVILKGRERIDYCYAEGMTVKTAYSEDRDVAFFEMKEASRLLLEAGDFAVFLPDDAHAPKLSAGAPSDVLKIVVKVAL
ncbi:YhcH/YjgK/YiaL family protein [Marispirochaeta aestuarii]|uniref:YhcH/YjgK/YiaL family protein n=1 Tax=Marispirochaeta aestuarii TaxID=1963862 RepID=UPI0029C81E57|nr:YhcH/YjgK/YiaL family protein [Marispirochaeta aestuarii]